MDGFVEDRDVDYAGLLTKLFTDALKDDAALTMELFARAFVAHYGDDAEMVADSSLRAEILAEQRKWNEAREAEPIFKSHSQHAKTAGIATPCTVHHVNFGGGCLNCGWEPLRRR